MFWSSFEHVQVFVQTHVAPHLNAFCPHFHGVHLLCAFKGEGVACEIFSHQLALLQGKIYPVLHHCLQWEICGL